ncbi:MAG: BBE domain-containing protein [Chitinophagaceae bacterium]|nr:BBE domain-containing protein [Chitinophagaceae bacterium]
MKRHRRFLTGPFHISPNCRPIGKCLRRKSAYLERFQLVQEIFTGNGIKAQYRNYPDINFNNWPELYYGNNYKRLQQVKAIHDPNNLFRYEQSIQKV